MEVLDTRAVFCGLEGQECEAVGMSFMMSSAVSCKALPALPGRLVIRSLRCLHLSAGVVQAIPEPSPSCTPPFLGLRADWLFAFHLVAVSLVSCLFGKQTY